MAAEALQSQLLAARQDSAWIKARPAYVDFGRAVRSHCPCRRTDTLGDRPASYVDAARPSPAHAVCPINKIVTHAPLCLCSGINWLSLASRDAVSNALQASRI